MKKTLFILLAALFYFPAFSQEDAEGCKDHSMFNRMPDFLIAHCSENFASLDAVIGAENKTQYEEGTRTNIDYLFNTASEHKCPSWLQVVRNYENAILKLGGKKIYHGSEFATFQIMKGGKEIWVMLSFISGSDLQAEEYYLDVLEKEPMKQDISASDIYAALNAEGRIALYINFETGKSDIKAESQSIIDQAAQMLKSNPSLKISIEGHTDNAGSAAANQTLSDSRAKAVLNALTAKGIDKSRLTSKGWGQAKPIADNATDDGKAKNRRVELVKL